MKRVLTIVMLLGVAGCSGAGIAGIGDPCGWLPVPNQEALVDVFGDFRDQVIGRTEVFGTIFTEGINNPNVFDPSPTELANCLDDMLDEAYGI